MGFRSRRMKSNKDKQIEFFEAYEFLNNHPAFLGSFWCGIESAKAIPFKVCANGIHQYESIIIYRNDDDFEKFFGKGHFESNDYGEILGEFPDNDYVQLGYDEYYGYKWEFDHIEFRIESGPHFYDFNNERWDRFYDHKITVDNERTYEESIIKFAKKVKERYGDFSSSQFDDNTIYPKSIVDNNKKYPAFNLDDFSENFVELKNGNFKIKRNEKNIYLKDQDINKLWWEKVGDSLGFKKSG